MDFWEQASGQAAREYGARYWRWFAAARVVRTVWPALAVLAGVGVAVLAWFAGSAAVSSLISREAGLPILWAAFAVVVIAAVALAVRGVVRSLVGPPRRRRRRGWDR